MALADRPADGLGNSITPLLMRLPVQLSDPLERLRASREASFEAMRTPGADRQPAERVGRPARALAARGRVAALHAARARGLPRAAREPRDLERARARDVAVLRGIRVTACHPLGPIYNGCSLNLTVMSYAGSLGIGAIGCPDTVPGLAEIPRAFEDEVADLLQIAHGGTAHDRRGVVNRRLARFDYPCTT
jgi:hypothetical protein